MKGAANTLALLLAASTLSWASLDDARAEPNLEKRSGLAMDNAAAALRDFRAAYNSGDLQKCMAKAQEKGSDFAVAEGVAIAREAVDKIKDRIAGLQVSAPLGKVETKARVQQVHDDLLTGLMGGKRK